MQIKARLSIKYQFKVQREGAIRQVRRRHKTGPKDYPFELRELNRFILHSFIHAYFIAPPLGAKNIARPRRRSLMKPGPFFLKKKKSYVLRPQSYVRRIYPESGVRSPQGQRKVQVIYP